MSNGTTMTMLWAFLAVVSVAPAQHVEVSGDGQHILHLTNGQQSAVDAFLRSHPDLLSTNCSTLKDAPADCIKDYSDWEQVVHDAKATEQFPYAAWGDYRHHGSVDLLMPFFTRTGVNNFGWRRWNIVVFEGVGPDQYKPVTALTGTWGACFDGVLYQPVRKQWEFWCSSMGGSVHWNGTAYVGKLNKGD
jgi:hypothetical protein